MNNSMSLHTPSLACLARISPFKARALAGISITMELISREQEVVKMFLSENGFSGDGEYQSFFPLTLPPDI